MVYNFCAILKALCHRGAAGQPDDYNDLTAADLAADPDIVIEPFDNDSLVTDAEHFVTE